MDDAGPPYSITRDRGPGHQAVSTTLDEIRRLEGWDDTWAGSFCSFLADLLVIDGPRAGELIQATLETGLANVPFPRASGPRAASDWLAPVPEPSSGDGRR